MTAQLTPRASQPEARARHHQTFSRTAEQLRPMAEQNQLHCC
ncbi:hypothetical protein [Gloeobacter morelensis]|nr:hypothetical protein [Gloeobacter morelensis]